MAPAQGHKSVVLVRSSMSGPCQERSDFLHGLRLTAKVGYMFLGIPCFGLLFVLSILLIVSGVAALGLGEIDVGDDDGEDDDDTQPALLKDPFDSAGTVMLLTGVVMLAALICLWYMAEKRHNRRLISSTPSAPAGSHLVGVDSFPSSVTDSTTGDAQTVACPTGGSEQPFHRTDITMISGEQMTQHTGQGSYPGEPSRCGMSYPGTPTGDQMSFFVSPSGCQMSYPGAPTGNQMLYPAVPPSSQYTRPVDGHSSSFSSHPGPYPRQYRPTERAYQPEAPTLEEVISGLAMKVGFTDDVNIDLPSEPPPPYTP